MWKRERPANIGLISHRGGVDDDRPFTLVCLFSADAYADGAFNLVWGHPDPSAGDIGIDDPVHDANYLGGGPHTRIYSAIATGFGTLRYNLSSNAR